MRLQRWFDMARAGPTIADDTGAEAGLADALAGGARLISGLPPRRCLVFLLVANTVRSVSAYLALLEAGHAVLLLDAETSGDILRSLGAAYRPDAILRPDREEPVELTGQGGHDLHPDLAVLLSTSGSTGSPKLARFSLGQLMENAAAIASYLSIGPDERPILLLPFHYSFGLSVLHSHLLKGARVELTRHSLMQKEFWERIRSAQATSFSGVPFHYEAMKRLGFGRIDAPSVRTWTQAGGRLGPDQVRYWATETAARGCRFFVMYGQTEAGPRMSYVDPADLPEHAASIGRAIPGATLSLIDDKGREIAEADREGELVCQSPSIMMGYAFTPEDLALGDVMGGRLQTGDLARRDADGRYFISGRKSRFVKLMGVRVNLDDIENLARSTGFSAAVAGRDDLVVIGIEGASDADAEALKQRAIDVFSFPPRALRVRALESLPRGAGGKPRYADLLAMLDPNG
jgi:acyl-coenzyme A synthetase/AMP-(fatty) acid ligase